MSSGFSQFHVLSPSITAAVTLACAYPAQYRSLSPFSTSSCWHQAAWAVTHSRPSAEGHLVGLTEQLNLELLN